VNARAAVRSALIAEEHSEGARLAGWGDHHWRSAWRGPRARQSGPAPGEHV